ncbi:MAG: hypothetical protein OEV01_10165 [Nitrospira sp.]|nr:hypothetical protein [Nitrospira sp.]MDH4303932.1 hypothetical protein [Nitrospira sp.]MDH5193846.1 hypothetical protein [Nitrospira sp.]
MITVKNQFVQQVLAAITLAFVLGALSIVWPAIIAVFLGILLLLQSFSGEPEIAILSWAEVENVSIAIDALRQPSIPAILS